LILFPTLLHSLSLQHNPLAMLLFIESLNFFYGRYIHYLTNCWLVDLIYFV
jgi:hypothetical protein